MPISRGLHRNAVGAFVCLALACTSRPVTQDAGGETSGSGGIPNDPDGPDDPPDETDDWDPGGPDWGDGVPPEPDVTLMDVLFVVDNTRTMAASQLRLARAMPGLVEDWLETSLYYHLDLDVNVMVTTTDHGNPLCLPDFYSEPREPERGAPVSTNCNDRLARFTFPVDPPEVKEWACTEMCPDPSLAPEDPFVNFSEEGDNVAGAAEIDVDGDGEPDSAAAQALACLIPQGIDGCGFESQLETMLHALSPAAEWNTGPRPFLRDGARLAIVLVTDEYDCSINDYSIMEDEQFHETDPSDGTRKATSALCWNAGVSCTGPDANGIYSDCRSVEDHLQPVSRYTGYLIDELRESQGKDVYMVALVGVPPVTEHNANAPFNPVSGGVLDLVYRTWNDGEYPAGDVIPEEWAQGITAADKQFAYGIGPGCTGEDGRGGHIQGLPPVRIKEVCQALDFERDNGDVAIRCCIESICDDYYDPALNCLLDFHGGLVPDG